MKAPRLPKVLLPLLVAAGAATAAFPLVLEGQDLVRAWWGVAAFALLGLGALALSWSRFVRRLQEQPRPLPEGEPVAIDFDRPWKGGNP